MQEIRYPAPLLLQSPFTHVEHNMQFSLSQPPNLRGFDFRPLVILFPSLVATFIGIFVLSDNFLHIFFIFKVSKPPTRGKSTVVPSPLHQALGQSWTRMTSPRYLYWPNRGIIGSTNRDKTGFFYPVKARKR